MSQETIVKTLLTFYPDAEAVYLFGSYLTPDETRQSDVDVAVLLPPRTAKRLGSLAMSECRSVLEEALNKTVDLINLRMVNTVFQNEIVQEGRLVCSQNDYVTDVFEMQVLSAYQKLNEERAGILEDVFESGSIVK